MLFKHAVIAVKKFTKQTNVLLLCGLSADEALLVQSNCVCHLSADEALLVHSNCACDLMDRHSHTTRSSM